MILTLTEAARRLSISPSTLARLTRQGKISRIQLSSRRIGYAEDELARYLREGWQSENYPVDGSPSSLSKLADEYFAACRQVARARTRSNLKPSFAAHRFGKTG